MFRMSKAEVVFFDLFEQASEKANQCANALYALATDYTDVAQKVKAIEVIEHECDLLVHETMKYLNAAFITPIDREDIFEIAKEMDNIVDAIEAIAHRFVMFNVQSITEDAKDMCKLITQCTRELHMLMSELVRMKKSKSILQHIIEVNRIENEGDKLYRSAITNLFTNEKDPIEVVKWKGIYEYLENALDACEDVANIIEGVVMKNA